MLGGANKLRLAFDDFPSALIDSVQEQILQFRALSELEGLSVQYLLVVRFQRIQLELLFADLLKLSLIVNLKELDDSRVDFIRCLKLFHKFQDHRCYIMNLISILFYLLWSLGQISLNIKLAALIIITPRKKLFKSSILLLGFLNSHLNQFIFSSHLFQALSYLLLLLATVHESVLACLHLLLLRFEDLVQLDGLRFEPSN